MTSTDTEYLKERIAKKNALDATQVTTNKSDTTQLEDTTSDVPDLREQIRQRKLHRQAEKLDAEDTAISQKAQDKETKAQAQKDKQLEEDRVREEGTARERATLAGNKVGAVVDNAQTKASSLVDTVSSFKTTGGISMLLVILVVLLFIVVRINASGDTRFKQLWYMLNGKTQLTGKVTLTGATQVPGSNSTQTPNASQNGGGDTPGGTTANYTGNGVYTSNLGYRGNTTF